jgi:hypothetical protein
MTEPLDDTWHSRDLPVLRTVVSLIDSTGETVDSWDVASILEIDVKDVERAMLALHRGGYVVAQTSESWGGVTADAVKSVTGDAYRAAGAWPNADAVADRMLATLEDLAEHGSDELEKSKARKALEGLRSLTRDTLVSVAGAAAGVAMQ